MIHLKSPYIPEYLAFREATFFKEAFDKLKKNSPELLPQVMKFSSKFYHVPEGLPKVYFMPHKPNLFP